MLTAALAALALPGAAQDVGTTVPELVLEDLSQTGAESYGDFVGRAVLLEFFAYW
jgi:hypothetical protein